MVAFIPLTPELESMLANSRLIRTLLSLLVIPSCAIAQRDIHSARHPAPGTSIVRFAQVDVGLYKGSKPKTDADYSFPEIQELEIHSGFETFPASLSS